MLAATVRRRREWRETRDSWCDPIPKATIPAAARQSAVRCVKSASHSANAERDCPHARVGVSVATYPRTPGFRFCYPVRSEPCSLPCNFRPLGPRVTQREQVLRCRWHLCVLSLLRVTQPGRKQCFSTHVDPGSAPSGNPSLAGLLVEPPGTAPGSSVPIAHYNSSPSPVETGEVIYRDFRLNGK